MKEVAENCSHLLPIESLMLVAYCRDNVNPQTDKNSEKLSPFLAFFFIILFFFSGFKVFSVFKTCELF